MSKAITYPLDVALGLSPVWGAIFVTSDGKHIRIDPVEDWVIWFDGSVVPGVEREEVAARAWLRANGIPENRGWLPELPVYVANEGRILKIEDDRFQ